MKTTVFFVFTFIYSPFIFSASLPETPPALLLAKVYENNIQLDDYWVSEKLDGVRAYWDGKNLISRQGNVFHAPYWFIKVLPEIKLDGELWLGRSRFDELSARVRKTTPVDKDWHDIKYMIFDLPGNKAIFTRRLAILKTLVYETNVKHIQLINQFKLSSPELLMQKLDELVKLKAEGLMLHRGSSFYKSGRQDDLLKLKRYLDAEAIVIKHIPGKGKFKGVLGSLLVETKDKKRFKLGSGFSLKERKNPPAIGALVTYKYFGLTNKGVPRFASFMRVRDSY
jgi:DNA ligase-1